MFIPGLALLISRLLAVTSRWSTWRVLLWRRSDSIASDNWKFLVGGCYDCESIPWFMWWWQTRNSHHHSAAVHIRLHIQKQPDLLCSLPKPLIVEKRIESHPWSSNSSNKAFLFWKNPGCLHIHRNSRPQDCQIYNWVTPSTGNEHTAIPHAGQPGLLWILAISIFGVWTRSIAPSSAFI